jgi:hypothetical protein
MVAFRFASVNEKATLSEYGSDLVLRGENGVINPFWRNYYEARKLDKEYEFGSSMA